MRLLILGGTVFLGRHLVEAAVGAGHTVTTFTRGEHPAVLPAGVEQLRGNRDSDLSALEGRQWDAVIDTSGYFPREIVASMAILAGAVGHYTFISSISAYADFAQVGMTEVAPLGTLADPTVEEITGETYGPLKALCEGAAQAAMPGRTLVIRPGLIVGPYDPTDRFTYWPHRVAAGGAVLAPGRPERVVQFIDARDLAAWALRLAERQVTGVYHATGPAAPLPFGDLLAACQAVTGASAALTWVGESFLAERGVEPWSVLPLWIPESDPSHAGFCRVDCSRALGAGLAFRPLEQTVRDTLDWAATRPADRVWKAGLTREREAELLAAWREAGG
ncbi:MAG TPA: NAD-dependent epimerase/dehydratase family protein [Ktedonobacterales bacterium]|nr:NAD-dependent epimerase/dehydratase family protein [Ktedonobacterales bacterium]